jgi:glutamine synthetase
VASNSNSSIDANVALGSNDLRGKLGLDGPDFIAALERVAKLIDDLGIEVVRVSFVDVHGILRSRPIEVRHFRQVARNGMPTTSAILSMDTANNIAVPIFSADGGLGRSDMGGGGDMYILPDLATFRQLPWDPTSAMVLGDIYLRSGERCPFDSRYVMQRECDRLKAMGFDFMGGVEVECSIFTITDPALTMADSTMPATPPSVIPPQHGYQYFSSEVVDGAGDLIADLRKALIGLGLPLRMIEPEWGPGQIEITFDPLLGIEAADAVVYLKTAVKQVARRRGMLASFMATPGLPNAFSTGWHLHQSLVDRSTGVNAFLSADAVISQTGRNFVGGLIEHFAAGAAFSNPTINGYKRLNASPLSPKYATWSHHNKGAMVRLIGGVGDQTTHLENRVGEPAANPYLYMASQIAAGIDGIERQTNPGDPVVDPLQLSDKPVMPIDLIHAIEALEKSSIYKSSFGEEFVNYYLMIQQHAIRRFLSTVTDWEHKEYFERY